MNLLGKGILPGLLALALSACGGGGGGGGQPNLPPTAVFTASPSAGQAPLTVTFDASGSTDADGSLTSYLWNFGDDTTGSGVTASHTYQVAGNYTASLTVNDNRGATARTTRAVTVTSGPVQQVTVSGRITFERVPFVTLPQDGLDYPGTFEAPAREIEVQLLRTSDQAVLATTTTDGNGHYSVVAPANTNVRVRAKALSRFAGSGSRPAAWDLRVLNNTNSNALYVLDGTSFDTGIANQTRNLKATTGWSGGFAGVYTGPRAAAPFAILDTLYEAAQFIFANGDDSAQLPALSAFWSEENRNSDVWDPASGNIVTTQFTAFGTASEPAGIYILGNADLGAGSDTDEFDQHVVAHEFQHFLESALSRSDSPGGDHSLSDLIDMRVSFSEGYSDAFAAMVLDDPLYRDSYGVAQGSDVNFDIESDASPIPGWYSEVSVARIAWDLFDPADDDGVAIGFGPLFDATRSALRDASPLGSLFSFVAAVRDGVDATTDAAIDARVRGEGNIDTPTEPYAGNETHSGVATADSDVVLPIYSPTAVNGPPVRVCGDALEGGTMTYNKLGNRRFLRFDVPSARTVTVRVTCPTSESTCLGTPEPDPDFVLSQGRDAWFAESITPRTETLRQSVPAGAYVLEVYEYSHIDPGAAAPRGRTCMTVSIEGPP